MDKEVFQLIEDYIHRQQWKKARSLILKELRIDRDDHWLISRLATTYYEEGNYEKALELEKEARKLSPRCPLVLWGYANALDMLRQETKAIRVWKQLLRRGEDDIAKGECGEGVRWTRSLLNDCRYRIALAYRDLGKFDIALQYLKEHIENRSPGIPSIYPLSEVKKKLAQLQEQLHQNRKSIKRKKAIGRMRDLQK